MSELRLSCIRASRSGWPRRRCQIVEEVVAAKAAEEKEGEEGETDTGNRRV
jgi:hypothetical protein